MARAVTAFRVCSPGVCGLLHDRAHSFFSYARWNAGDLGLAAALLVVSLLVPAGAPVDVDDVRAARGLTTRHSDLKFGITDALNAVLADRYDTNEILTTGQRHFRVITRSAANSTHSESCPPTASLCLEEMAAEPVVVDTGDRRNGGVN